MDILLLVLIAAIAAIVLWRWANRLKPTAPKPSHSNAETVVSAPQRTAFHSSYGFKNIEEERSQLNAVLRQQADARTKFCRERHNAIVSVMVDYVKSKHCRGVYFAPKFPADTYWIRDDREKDIYGKFKPESLVACVLVDFDSAFQTGKSNLPLEVKVIVKSDTSELEKLGEALAEAVGSPRQTYKVVYGFDFLIVARIERAEEPQTALEL